MISEVRIPISAVRLGAEVEDLVVEVIRSGSLVQGPMVRRLEEEFGATTVVPPGWRGVVDEHGNLRFTRERTPPLTLPSPLRGEGEGREGSR